MDTDLLKTFLEVARTRHFGKAADNLFLTRSAVSFRVKQLESVLGVALFARQRNNIQLTSAGERMLVHAEAILTAWERAKQDISLSNEQSIQLAIGAVPNIWGLSAACIATFASSAEWRCIKNRGVTSQRDESAIVGQNAGCDDFF